MDLNWMLIFCSHELLQFRSWPSPSPAVSNSGWSALLWLGGPNPPSSLPALLQYPWTIFTHWQSPSHHLYSEMNIVKSGISLNGEGREEHSGQSTDLKSIWKWMTEEGPSGPAGRSFPGVSTTRLCRSWAPHTTCTPGSPYGVLQIPET